MDTPALSGNGTIPQHTFLLFTKRVETMREALFHHEGRSWPLPNVYVGVSVEDELTANLRIPELLEIPAVGRFVLIQPMLEEVTLTELTRAA